MLEILLAEKMGHRDAQRITESHRGRMGLQCQRESTIAYCFKKLVQRLTMRIVAKLAVD